MQENLTLFYTNNKAADQTGHLPGLIIFVNSLSVKAFNTLTSSYYAQNFNILASLCSGTDWFESYFVGNPEDSFSCVKDHSRDQRVASSRLT